MAPIHSAARTGNLNRVRQLVNQGVAVNVRDDNRRWTPLHYAAYSGHLPIIRFLLNHGAHVNARAVDDIAPLHIASRAGRLNVVKELLNRGAPVHARMRRGLTPLHVAVDASNPNIVKELVRHGAKLSQQSEYMITPRGFARSNATRSALGARAANKFQNFRKKSIAARRAPLKNLSERVFSPERVRRMTAKYGNNWLNKV